MVSAPPRPGQNAPPQRRVPFQAATTRTRVNLSDLSLDTQNQIKQVDLFAAGFLAYVKIQIYGTITTGTSASGTWDANYWPYNLLQRLVLRSNNGFEFYNTSGFLNLPIQMYHRIGFNPGVPISPLSFNSGTQGARVAVQQAPTGALASSTAYPILVNYMIPVVSHPDLRAGLLPLQNNATKVTVVATLGNATDWAGAAATLGSGATISLTMRTMMEFFSVPADPYAQPDLAFIHRIEQQDQQWTASGEIDYIVPVNGIILRAWANIRNGTAPAVWFGTANNPNTQQFGNMEVTYAASQVPEVFDFKHALYQHRLDYNQDLPNGLLMWDFASGAGSIEQGVSARDAYNTRKLTEFRLKLNTSITPGANSVVQYVRQELQPRRAA